VDYYFDEGDQDGNQVGLPFQKFYGSWNAWSGVNHYTKSFFKRFINGEKQEIKQSVVDATSRGQLFNIANQLGFKMEIVCVAHRMLFVVIMKREQGFVFAKPGAEPIKAKEVTILFNLFEQLDAEQDRNGKPNESPFRKFYENWNVWNGVDTYTKAFFERFIDGKKCEIKEPVEDSALKGEMLYISSKLGFKMVNGYASTGFMANLSRPAGFVFSAPGGKEAIGTSAIDELIGVWKNRDVVKDEPMQVNIFIQLIQAD
jgi:hypothetical protein